MIQQRFTSPPTAASNLDESLVWSIHFVCGTHSMHPSDQQELFVRVDVGLFQDPYCLLLSQSSSIWWLSGYASLVPLYGTGAIPIQERLCLIDRTALAKPLETLPIQGRCIRAMT